MIEKNRITTILFDLGGVLIQLHGMPFKPSWLPDGKLDADVWTHWKNSDAVSRFETGQIDGNQFARQFIDEVGLVVGEDEFIEHFMRWPARLFPGVPAMLEELAQSYRLAALSNSNALHWPKVMQDMRLQVFIPDCISSHQIRVMKPGRQAFEAALQRLNLQPEETLFLDDLQVSIDMARELGMQAVKVTGTVGGVETVRSLGLLSE
ncbi:MAG: HAD family phosphatase [Gammaproteobacteria bacterium]|jgi:putative hydrolase of the HAD superfamily|nr:HAD family phosphatase [Gammaproteobacteria bacterium]